MLNLNRMKFIKINAFIRYFDNYYIKNLYIVYIIRLIVALNNLRILIKSFFGALGTDNILIVKVLYRLGNRNC